MNKAFVLATSLLFAFHPQLFSQTVKDTVFAIAERMPEYPGGRDMLIEEISARVVYPQQCLDSNIEGKVYLRFVVDTDGSITDIVAGKGPHTALREAAIAAAKQVGLFRPGMQNGKPVRVYYSVPITFRLAQQKAMPIVTEPIRSQSPPEFPGGGALLIKWVQANVEYPLSETGKGIEGKVTVLFTITENGLVENAEVKFGLGPAFNQEALRVINALPPFKPALQNGKPVSATYTLAVSFKEEEHKPKYIGPQFPGGVEALNKWFQNWMDNPAFRHTVRGGSVEFICTFSADGHATNVVVRPSANYKFDLQMQKIAYQFPDFLPATLDGKPVESTLNLRFSVY